MTYFGLFGAPGIMLQAYLQIGWKYSGVMQQKGNNEHLGYFQEDPNNIISVRRPLRPFSHHSELLGPIWGLLWPTGVFGVAGVSCQPYDNHSIRNHEPCLGSVSPQDSHGHEHPTVRSDTCELGIG